MVLSTKYKIHKCGFLLIELVIAAGLLALLAWALFSLQTRFVRAKSDGVIKIRATWRAIEALEAIRSVRDSANSWSSFTGSITPGSNYHPTIDTLNGVWQIASGDEPSLDGLFTRRIQFEQVCKDAGGFVASCPGTDDPDRRKVTVTTYFDPAGANPSAQKIQLSTYLTAWKSKISSE